MQQDYKPRQHQARRKNTGLIPGMLIIALILLLVIAYVKHNKTRHLQHPPTTKHSTTTTHAADDNGEFDFYTLLPEMNSNAAPTDSTPPLQSASKQAYYVLQIASIKDPKNGEALRDQLGALGITSYIEKAAHDNGWYHVLAGPYLTADAAKQDQQRLSSRHIESLLITKK